MAPAGLAMIAFLSMWSYSFCASTKFDRLPINAFIQIAEYLDYPFATLGSINRSARTALIENFPLKQMIIQRFDLDEIAEVANNEGELQYILTLSRFANDPRHLYQALVEDVLNRKLPYDRLYILMVAYIDRINKTLLPQEQEYDLDENLDNLHQGLVHYHINRGEIKSSFDDIMSNPREIFSSYFDKTNYDECFGMIDTLLSKQLWLNKNLKDAIGNFQVLATSSEEFKAIFYSNFHDFISVIRYYAVKNIKILNDRLIIEIVAPESSLALGLPPSHRFNLELNSENIFNLLHSEGYFHGSSTCIWSLMKVIDEETFYSFLNDFEQLPISFMYKTKVETSLEIIKFVLSSPRIIEKLRSIGIRLCFLNDEFEFIVLNNLLEFLDLIEDTEGLLQVFNLNSFPLRKFITRLRTRKQLKKFEEFLGTTVAEMFLSRDEGNMTENDYFKWKLAFKHWIKSDQKYRISEIESPIISELLMLDNYDEINEIILG